ncbi:MAG TPA: hypothetical protein VK208_19665 [Pyrinomonadaceae bacterium]|jgi:hypothetical protein|nr:hypothetical protein [Pyrinomonadaceae bacterium]
MPPGLLLGLVLIPSMLFTYVVLTTLYGPARAYIGISWLPIAFSLVIWSFRLLLGFQSLSDEWWRGLATTIVWASLAQAALGMGLIVRSLYLKQGTISLLLATSASASPFLIGIIR